MIWKAIVIMTVMGSPTFQLHDTLKTGYPSHPGMLRQDRYDDPGDGNEPARCPGDRHMHRPAGAYEPS